LSTITSHSRFCEGGETMTSKEELLLAPHLGILISQFYSIHGAASDDPVQVAYYKDFQNVSDLRRLAQELHQILYDCNKGVACAFIAYVYASLSEYSDFDAFREHVATTSEHSH